MMDAIKRKQLFLRDNPNFSFIKNEIRIDKTNGQQYCPFERFIDFKERININFVFVYKEKKQNVYRLIPGSHFLERYNYQKRAKLLFDLIILLSFFFVFAEIINILIGSLLGGLFVLSIFIFLAYIPLQILYDMLHSLHIYYYSYDNSPKNLAEGCCFHKIRELMVFPALFTRLPRFSFIYYPVLFYKAFRGLLESSKMSFYVSYIKRHERYKAEPKQVSFLLGLVSTLDATIQTATVSQYEFLSCFVEDIDGKYRLLK